MLLQVGLERAKTGDQRTRLPEGPEAHVHAKHETFRRLCIEEPDQRLPEPREVVLVRDLAPAVGLAGFRIEKDEVDVRGEIELAAAELSHADHDELLGLAGRRSRHAVCRGKRAGREARAPSQSPHRRGPTGRASTSSSDAPQARSRHAMRTSSLRRSRRSPSMNFDSSGSPASSASQAARRSGAAWGDDSNSGSRAQASATNLLYGKTDWMLSKPGF